MLNYTRLRNTLKAWGDKFSGKLKSYLKTQGFKATGETIDSIKPRVRKKGETLNLEFSSKAKDSYAIPNVINRGRRRGTPPPYMEIEKWIKAKGVPIRNKGKFVKHKGRFVKHSDSNVKRAAIGIAKGIGRKGLITRFQYKGTDMYKSLFVPEEPALKQEITNAYQKDIEAYIKRQNKNVK